MAKTGGRIGVIYPSDGAVDKEFWRFAPPGVTVHLTRSITSLHLDQSLSFSRHMEMMAESDDLEQAARTFGPIEADCVAYACTAASFCKGVGYDKKIIERIRDASGIPATTTSTAAVAAMRELGLRKLAVATPYEDEPSERLRSFLEGSGFEVVALKNLGLSDKDIWAVTGDQVNELGKRTDTPEADGLFISCTALPTSDFLDDLERDLGKPVVSANQATMWHSLRVAGIDAHLEGLGRLYRLQMPQEVSP